MQKQPSAIHNLTVLTAALAALFTVSHASAQTIEIPLFPIEYSGEVTKTSNRFKNNISFKVSSAPLILGVRGTNGSQLFIDNVGMLNESERVKTRYPIAIYVGREDAGSQFSSIGGNVDRKTKVNYTVRYAPMLRANDIINKIELVGRDLVIEITPRFGTGKIDQDFFNFYGIHATLTRRKKTWKGNERPTIGTFSAALNDTSLIDVSGAITHKQIVIPNFLSKFEGYKEWMSGLRVDIDFAVPGALSNEDQSQSTKLIQSAAKCEFTRAPQFLCAAKKSSGTFADDIKVKQ